MVGIIVGTLVKIGCGMIPEESMKEILEARDRAKAGPRAPAQGLTLKSIYEEEELVPVIDEENPHWSYVLDQQEIVSDGIGRLQIRRVDEADYDRMLLRLTKQLSRNGAEKIVITDETGRLKDGMTEDYFTYHLQEDGTFVTRDEHKEKEITEEEG